MLNVPVDGTASAWWWFFPQKFKGREGGDEKDRLPACSAQPGFNLRNEPWRLQAIAKIIALPDAHLQLFVYRRYRRVRIANDKLQECLLLGSNFVFTSGGGGGCPILRIPAAVMRRAALERQSRRCAQGDTYGQRGDH